MRREVKTDAIVIENRGLGAVNLALPAFEFLYQLTSERIRTLRGERVLNTHTKTDLN